MDWKQRIEQLEASIGMLTNELNDMALTLGTLLYLAYLHKWTTPGEFRLNKAKILADMDQDEAAARDGCPTDGMDADGQDI